MSIKILRKKHAYKTEAIKMADGKVTGRLSKSQRHEGKWIKYPCLYDKGNQDYHDRNKRDIAKTQIVNSLNELLGYEDSRTKAITGKPETVSLLKYYYFFIHVGVTGETVVFKYKIFFKSGLPSVLRIGCQNTRTIRALKLSADRSGRQILACKKGFTEN